MKLTLSLFLVFCFPFPVLGDEDPWVETAVRDALVGALTGNEERVSSVRSVLEEDRLESSDRVTGVEDDIALLEILASTQTQKQKAEQIQKLAKDLNDPAAKERLLDLSKRSNDFRLEQLIKKRRMNRYTSVINRTWQTTSQVLAGQPSALGVAGIDVAKAVTGRSDATVTDKKIAHLAALQEIRGEAGEEDIEDGLEILHRVEGKKDRQLRKNCIRTIERAQKEGDWWRVREFSIHGVQLWPEESLFSESLALADENLFRENDAPPISQDGDVPSEEEVVLLRRKIVAAEAVRFTPTAGSRKEIDIAEANRRNQTLDYLMFGDTTVTTFSEHSAKTAIVHGGDTPAALAFFQAAESAFRAATLVFGNDLGVDQAIETYARIAKENPEALTRKDYLDWADLYSKKDRDDQSIALLEGAGIDDERRIRKYRKRWAGGIVKRCRDLPPSKERYQALTYVKENLPETKGAKEAKKLLREMPRTERSLIRVERQDLKSFRPELMEAGFSFPEQWWDDQKSNGELEEDSLFWDPNEAVLWYRVTKKSPWRKQEQGERCKERVVATFQKIEDRSFARLLKQERSTGRRFPLEIEGALGGGSYVTPQLVQYDLSDPDDLYYE